MVFIDFHMINKVAVLPLSYFSFIDGDIVCYLHNKCYLGIIHLNYLNTSYIMPSSNTIYL